MKSVKERAWIEQRNPYKILAQEHQETNILTGRRKSKTETSQKDTDSKDVTEP